jgi:hypothetical protein
LATFVSSALHCVTWLERAHPTLPTLLHSVVLIGFHPSFIRNGTNYSRSVVP